MTRKKAKRGGSRRGAGRKQSRLPPALAAKLGSAPLGQPLKLARWFTDAIAALTQLVMEGETGYQKMLETVRASAGAAGRVIPHDILYEAHRILDADSKDVTKGAGGAQPVKRKKGNAERERPGASRRDPD